MTAAVVATVVAGGWYAYEHFLGTSDAPFAGTAAAEFPEFVDRTADFGISVDHRQGDEQLTGLDEALGSGACALDYDGDGWIDLFIVNGSGDARYYGRRHWWQEARGHRLLRNVGGQRFEDVTGQAGITAVSQGLGCVAADFDNDGFTDLLVTNVGATLLLRNQGDGRFRDVSENSGLQGNGWHTAAAVADADGDGKLDLYIGGFIDFGKGARTYEPGSQFRQDTPPFFNSALYPALPNHLYRNQGGMHFEDVTDKAGVADGDGRTLAALWTDVNDDRKPDLIVLNAAGTGSTTGYINHGDWRFEPMGIKARIESGLSFRGISLGDFNNDGRADMVLTSAAGHQTALLFRDETPRGGDPQFRDQARGWQVAREEYAALSPWSPGVADFNNDGWPDLVVVNGQILPDPDSPHVTIGQPKQIWINDGQAHLRAYKPPPLSPLLDRQSARGLVVADFNNDGNVDLYVAHNNDLGQLLLGETRSPRHWLGVQLQDSDRNPGGVGAEVRVTTELGGQSQWVTRGMGFLSDGDPRLHFGLGAATRATVAVLWPNGSTATYRNVPLDSYLTVSRTDGLTAGSALPSRTSGTAGVPERTSPDTRREYYIALSGVASAPGIDALMRAALIDPDPAVRAAVVTSLTESKTGSALRLLVRFLEDPSEDIAALAVDGVCGFEEEDTTRFLLRTFAHSSAKVRARTADCFTRYNRDFQDQKAVIERKNLAAPYLAALLADKDTQVQIAAARALGASEEFRGVAPLISLLESPDPEVQSEAVRALGLIRDRLALPALIKLSARANLAAPTYAQIFIALKRLDYAALDVTLAGFAGGSGDAARVPLERRLESFLEILETPEGVVLPRQRMVGLATVAYSSAAADDDAALLYARICGVGRISTSAAAVAPLLRSASSAVREAAYLASLALDPPGRTALVAAALHDPDIGVRVHVLEQLARDDIVVPDTLLQDALLSPDTAGAAAGALRQVRSGAVIEVLTGWVQDASASADLRIAALRALGRARYQLTLPDSLFRTAPEELRLAMLEFETARLPEIFVSRTPPAFLLRYLKPRLPVVQQAAFDFLLTREEIWAKQLVLDLLRDPESAELRRHVISRLPADYFKDGAPLVAIAANPTDPLRYEALRRLNGNVDPHAIQGLTDIARNERDDRQARVLAAAGLPETLRKNLLPGLLGS